MSKFSKYGNIGKNPVVSDLPLSEARRPTQAEIQKRSAIAERLAAKNYAHPVFITNSRGSYAPAPFNIIAFTVPPGNFLEIQKCDVIISDPYIAKTSEIGWRILIDGGLVPNILDQGSANGAFNFSFGDVADPIEFTPFIIQPNQVFQLEIVRGADEYCIVTGILQGQLLRDVGVANV